VPPASGTRCQHTVATSADGRRVIARARERPTAAPQLKIPAEIRNEVAPKDSPCIRPWLSGRHAQRSHRWHPWCGRLLCRGPQSTENPGRPWLSRSFSGNATHVLRAHVPGVLSSPYGRTIDPAPGPSVPCLPEPASIAIPAYPNRHLPPEHRQHDASRTLRLSRCRHLVPAPPGMRLRAYSESVTRLDTAALVLAPKGPSALSPGGVGG
jgi:hypothetical protein